MESDTTSTVTDCTPEQKNLLLAGELPKTSPDACESGKIHYVTGPMFAGKTETAVFEATKPAALVGTTLVLKPNIDTRNAETHGVATISTHNGKKCNAVLVSEGDIMEFMEKASCYDRIVIDEAQFIRGIAEFCLAVKQMGKSVLVAGLDYDFMLNKFPETNAVEKIADRTTRLEGTCAKCGAKAKYTARTSDSKEIILIGGSDCYYPACGKCHPYSAMVDQ